MTDKPSKQTAKLIPFPRTTEIWTICPDCGCMSFGILRADFPDGRSGVRLCCDGKLADGTDCDFDIQVQMILGVDQDEI
jgi:hypothetical protein